TLNIGPSGSGASTKVSAFGRLCADAWSEGEVKVERRCSDEQKNPESAVTSCLIERACIPLIVTDRRIGLLDMRWKMMEGFVPLDTRELESELRYLGHLLAVDYSQYLLTKALHLKTRNLEKLRGVVLNSRHRVNDLSKKLSPAIASLE